MSGRVARGRRQVKPPARMRSGVPLARPRPRAHQRATA
ncbi:hypothetical protein C7S16_4235 [Burkholderia thailandensis]|uniref:Uncharacterized protein n=1 Tax=Burkholderia thailandensis TaxID=57975 RepID=A0AAW9CPX8_BURTH|nr:hypothetical protein [Burkholderia thailandensis]MDW9252650.1 hypothetical protein [Burkholderia thailandensis]